VSSPTASYFATLPQIQADLAQLQGVWTSIAGRRQAELLIAGNLFTVRFLDGALYMGTFALDLDESPKAMDMRIDEGPIKHKGHIAHCIYDLAGDRLQWCPGEPGSERRPRAFPGDEDGQSLCLLFRREYSRRRNE
jgi:uncharacterized protein (TIGR03067 family)